MIDLTELIEAEKKATKGPFAAYERCPGSIAREFEILQPGGGVLFRSTSYGRMEEDANFIALSRNLCRPMIEEIERLEAKSIAQEMDLKTQENMIVQLRTELARAREVMEFYANENRYIWVDVINARVLAVLDEDPTKKAKKALRSIEESGVLK